MRVCHETTVDSVTVYLTRVDTRGGGDRGEHVLRQRARTLAVRAAATALHQSAARISVRREHSGRPLLVLAGRPAVGLHVALSHARAGTDGVVAAALSGLGPVGVDVEMVRDLPALALARRWLADPETAWLARLPEHRRTVAFLLLWTQKEAVGKALGVGLRGDGLRRRVPLPRDGEANGAGANGAGASDELRLAAMSGQPPMTVAAWVRGRLVLAVACAAEPAVAAPVVVVEIGGDVGR